MFEVYFLSFSVSPSVSPEAIQAFENAFRFASTVQTKMNEGIDTITSQFFAEADSRGLSKSEAQDYIAYRADGESERRGAFYAEARSGGSTDEHARSYALGRDEHNFTPETAHFYAQAKTQYNLNDSAAQRFAEFPRVRERVAQRHAEQARAQQAHPQQNRASQHPPRANAAPAAAARPEPALPAHIETKEEAANYMELSLRGLNPEILTSQFRLLARKMHPDKNLGDPNAHRKFTLLGDSHEILKRHLESNIPGRNFFRGNIFRRNN
jgi:hypothetical protein